MPRNQDNRSNRGNRGGSRSERSAFSWDTAREKPFATAVTIGAAAAAGAFLWSRRNQISDQLSDLTDQIGEWTENMSFSGSGESEFESAGGGSTSPGAQGRIGGTRGSRGTTGMSETGGGNASLGAQSGGGGMTTSASGRGRARGTRTT
jgi:hypothetical protein